MPNPIKDSFDFVIASYFDWYAALREPWSAAAHVLAGGTPRDHVTKATALWFSAFFLSLLFGLPIYFMFGLRLENLNFQLCALLTQYLTLLGFAALLHLSLRRYRITSNFGDTFALYTVIAAAFGPFVTLVSLPAVFRSLLITSQVKAKNLSAWQTAKEMLAASFAPDDSVATILLMASYPILLLLTIFVLATFVRLLAEHYGAPEPVVVKAVAFAFGGLCPALVIVAMVIQQMVLFVFVT